MLASQLLKNLSGAQEFFFDESIYIISTGCALVVINEESTPSTYSTQGMVFVIEYLAGAALRAGRPADANAYLKSATLLLRISKDNKGAVKLKE